MLFWLAIKRLHMSQINLQYGTTINSDNAACVLTLTSVDSLCLWTLSGWRGEVDTPTGRELVRSTRRCAPRHRTGHLRRDDARARHAASDAHVVQSAHARPRYACVHVKCFIFHRFHRLTTLIIHHLSLFHFRLKTFLFCSANPFHRSFLFLLQDWLHWFPGLFTDRPTSIRDAILTCARKPIWVSLIYGTETTTEKCKTEKLKTVCSEIPVKVWGIHVVSSEEEKERLWWEGFAEKEGFKPGMKEWVGDGKLISMNVSSINERIRFYS